MPVLSCWVDDRTMAILQRESAASGRSVEQLAEAAIESEAIKSLPGGLPGMHFADRSTLDLDLDLADRIRGQS